MDKIIKNILGISVIIFAIMASFAVVSYVSIYSKSIDSSLRSFSVTAEGEVVSIPDVAKFSVGVLTEGGTNIGDLKQKNAESSNNIVAFIKERGVLEKDIQTISYSVSPRYEVCYSRVCPPPRIVGYSINSVFRVRVRDFDKIGEIISGTIDKGANTVSDVSFVIDNPDASFREARNKAIAEAKIKAEELAYAAGFRIGRLLSINEGRISPFVSGVHREFMMEDSIAPASINIQPGSQEIKATVTLTYEIR